MVVLLLSHWTLRAKALGLFVVPSRKSQSTVLSRMTRALHSPDWYCKISLWVFSTVGHAIRTSIYCTAAEDYNMAAQRRVRKSCDKHEYFKLDSFCRPVEFYLWKNAGTEQALRFDIFAVVCDFLSVTLLRYYTFSLLCKLL